MVQCVQLSPSLRLVGIVTLEHCPLFRHTSKTMKGRHFLTLKDFTPEEIYQLLNLSRELKQKKQDRIPGETIQGRNVVLIFEKESTRTRCSFEVAAFDEGAHTTVLTNSHLGKKESIKDTAQVLSRLYDGIMFRGHAQSSVEELAAHSSVPVWNGLTDEYHPTQVLADLLTIQEHIARPFSEVKLVYAGDARNNTANSLMIASAKMGMQYTALAPPELFPAENLTAEMKELSAETGSRIEVTENIDRAVQGADVIYTDVWVSMGEEEHFAERIKLLRPYQVTMEMLKKTGNEKVIFLHCLPAFHDTDSDVAREIETRFGLQEMEVSDEVFQSSHSAVFDEAENRLHTIKAIMLATMS